MRETVEVYDMDLISAGKHSDGETVTLEALEAMLAHYWEDPDRDIDKDIEVTKEFEGEVIGRIDDLELDGSNIIASVEFEPEGLELAQNGWKLAAWIDVEYKGDSKTIIDMELKGAALTQNKVE